MATRGAPIRSKTATYPRCAGEPERPLDLRGTTIAMARTSVPNSATSQFYINTVDNTSLNYPSSDGYGYAVFGRVTAGLDVVDKIAAVATANDVPVST